MVTTCTIPSPSPHGWVAVRTDSGPRTIRMDGQVARTPSSALPNQAHTIQRIVHTASKQRSCGVWTLSRPPYDPTFLSKSCKLLHARVPRNHRPYSGRTVPRTVDQRPESRRVAGRTVMVRIPIVTGHACVRCHRLERRDRGTSRNNSSRGSSSDRRDPPAPRRRAVQRRLLGGADRPRSGPGVRGGASTTSPSAWCCPGTSRRPWRFC